MPEQRTTSPSAADLAARAAQIVVPSSIISRWAATAAGLATVGRVPTQSTAA